MKFENDERLWLGDIVYYRTQPYTVESVESDIRIKDIHSKKIKTVKKSALNKPPRCEARDWKIYIHGNYGY